MKNFASLFRSFSFLSQNMMCTTKKIGLLFLFCIILYACEEEPKEKQTQKKDTSALSTDQSATPMPAPVGNKVADSIMYIATVKNSNPENTYMDEWLRGAKVDSLAAFIFDAVYAEKLKAYDYVTGEVMTLQDVKNLEEEYKRENIGQILFTEDWYFDKEKLQMHKKVNSIMLGYFRYDDEGKLLGNKAGIRVYLNGTKPMRAAIDY